VLLLRDYSRRIKIIRTISVSLFLDVTSPLQNYSWTVMLIVLW